MVNILLTIGELLKLVILVRDLSQRRNEYLYNEISIIHNVISSFLAWIK
jgi:hypothetical protein